MQELKMPFPGLFESFFILLSEPLRMKFEKHQEIENSTKSGWCIKWKSNFVNNSYTETIA